MLMLEDILAALQKTPSLDRVAEAGRDPRGSPPAHADVRAAKVDPATCGRPHSQPASVRDDIMVRKGSSVCIHAGPSRPPQR